MIEKIELLKGSFTTSCLVVLSVCSVFAKNVYMLACDRAGLEKNPCPSLCSRIQAHYSVKYFDKIVRYIIVILL